MCKFHRYTIISFTLAAVLLLLSSAATPARAQVASDKAIADQFVYHYWNYQGDRVLGLVQSPLMEFQSLPVQYFEKGRLEDHSLHTADPAWQLMYGRLTVEMMEQAPWATISGTNLTYGDLLNHTGAQFLPPEGFIEGTMSVVGGQFVPYSSQLASAPGYIVPDYFWTYINRADLFPHGWLHDVGLPLTGTFEAEITVNGLPQLVVLQAFERAILSYNPTNPAEWQIERANVGTDMLLASNYSPLYLQPTRPTGPKRIEVNLTQQRMYAYEGDFMIYDIPISTGKPGWETPTGSFVIFSKLELHDMQGRARGEEWDVPNVPHVMYFREGGYAIHGTYWHNVFGTGARVSHGCVNAPLGLAEALYYWAPMGTPVIVYY